MKRFQSASCGSWESSVRVGGRSSGSCCACISTGSRVGFDSRRLTVPPLKRVVVQLTLSWLWASNERESIDFVLSVGLLSFALGALEDVCY
jgi:hypothetical protein